MGVDGERGLTNRSRTRDGSSLQCCAGSHECLSGPQPVFATARSNGARLSSLVDVDVPARYKFKKSYRFRWIRKVMSREWTKEDFEWT